MAMLFDNSSGTYVDTGLWNVANNDELTLTGWCTPSDLSMTDPRLICKETSGAPANATFQLAIDTGVVTHKARFRLNAGGATSDIAGGSLVADTEYFLVGRYDGSNMWVYVNMVQVGTTAKAGNVRQQSSDVWLADSEVEARSFEGVLDDLRVYERGLSVDELQTIYALRGRDGIVGGLVGRWMMNEQAPAVVASGAGSIIDLSSAGHHGTPGNSPVYEKSALEWNRMVA